VVDLEGLMDRVGDEDGLGRIVETVEMDGTTDGGFC